VAYFTPESLALFVQNNQIFIVWLLHSNALWNENRDNEIITSCIDSILLIPEETNYTISLTRKEYICKMKSVVNRQ